MKHVEKIIFIIFGYLSIIICFIYFYEHLSVSISKRYITFAVSTNLSSDRKNISSVVFTDITRIVHQSWKTHKLPERFYRWNKSWNQTCYPQWKHRLWNDIENRNLIVQHFPWFLKTYDGFKHKILRADSIRYFYMFKYGGIYADLDAECLKPFEHLLNGYDIVFGAMDGQYGIHIPEGYTQNSFMYSKPNQLFWLELIYHIMDINGKNANPIDSTGPVVLGATIMDYRKRFPNSIKIYPPKYFNPFSWLKKRETSPKECKDLNQMTQKELLICRAAFTESYVVQYHSQTWGRGKIL